MSDNSYIEPGTKSESTVQNPATPDQINVMGVIFVIVILTLFYVLVTAWPVIESKEKYRVFNLFGFAQEWPADKRMLFIVIIAGAIGSAVHALTSFTDFVGNNRFGANWLWWYGLRLPIGAALAIFFYFVVRGGLLVPTLPSGDVAPFSEKGTLALNPYSIAAFAALAGMFARSATDKLAEVFDALMSRKNPIKRDDALRDGGDIDVKPDKVVKAQAATLVITGKGLSSETEVKVNGQLKTPNFADNQIKISIVPDDVKDKGVLEVSVKNKGAQPVTKKIAIVDA